MTLFKKIPAARTLGLLLGVAFAVLGQTPKADEAGELPPNQTLERQMTGAETHRYKISLQKDEFFQVRVEQKGVDVALKLADASGKTLATMDSPNGKEGPETLSFVAATADSYMLEVSGFDAKAETGHYTIRREASRPATANDKKRVSVERLFVDGITARDTKGQSETAITKLEEAFRGWQELKDNYLIELTARQVKMVKGRPKRAAADAKYNEALALNKQGTKESLQAALLELTEVRRLYSELDDKEDEALALNESGYIYDQLDEKEKALEDYSLSILLDQSVGNKNQEAYTLTGIGGVYANLGENQKALDYFNRALLLFKADGDRTGQAYALNNIGSVHSDLGEKEKALGYYRQSLPLSKAVGDKRQEGITLGNIGGVYSKLGENQKALDYLNQALPLFKAIGNQRGEATTLNNIGKIYSDLGNRQRALEYYNQSLQLKRAVGDRRGEATTLSNIGGIYDDLGEEQKALEYFNQGLVLEKAVGAKGPEAITFNNIMGAWESLNNRRLAILYGKQSVNVYQSLRAEIKGLDKGLQQSFLGQAEHTYRELAELLIKEGRLPEAELILAMLKEEEYFQFVRGGEIASALDKRINLSPAEKDVLERYDKLADKLTRLGSEYGRLETEKTQPNVTPEKAEAIVVQQKAIDESLTVARAALDKFLEVLKKEFSPEDKRIAAVEEGLQAEVKGWKDPHVAVISTIVGKENLSIIVTTSDIQTAHIIPITEEKLNTLVGDFRAALTDPRADPRPAGQRLYEVLIKPLQKDLDGIQARTLVWSLDGNLRYAPMSALWDADKGYLIQRYANVVITLASRSNLALRPDGKTKWQALGVGVSKAVGGFSALGNVAEELSAIVRDSSVVSKAKETGVLRGRRLLDEQFTYDAFRSSLGRFPIVHAATHFTFISGAKDESLESFLLLGNGEKLTLAKIQSLGTIFNGVQLLSLSACDTAYGGKDADGREVEGFGAMAQKKGAKAVLATLWRVADESTRDLMIEFYGDYQKPNFNKAEALRQAQLALLQEPDKAATGKITKSVNASPKRFAHPYYWSPFILIGNWQ